MPMSPRLLRPRAVGGDSDVLRYIAAVEAADGQALEQAVKDAIRNFILGCKTDNIWSAIKASCILMGARTLSGALTPLAGSAPTNNNFVSGDYNRKTGLKGTNAATTNINTNYSGSASGPNDNHGAVYVQEATNTTNPFPVYFGTQGGGNDHVIFRTSSDTGALSSRFHSSSGENIASTGSATGLIGSSRSSAASYSFRAGGSDRSQTRASSSPVQSGTYLVFNNTTSGSGTASNGRIAFYSFGQSLSLSLLDSRVSTLFTAIGAAIP